MFVAHHLLLTIILRKVFFEGDLNMRALIFFLVGIVPLSIVSPSYGDVILYDSSVSGQTPDNQNL